MTQGAIVTLVIAAPTLIIEEDWHGRPMLDQPGHLWVIPTIIVAFAFALGGAIGTRGVDELWRNLWEGLIVGGSVAGLLLVADVGRRAMHDKAISEGVLRLWVEAAILSVVIASLGGAISYFHATRSR
ncbi:MAG: hypothetical protein ACRDVW_09280 [Acidimicrobiales bacterium]